MPKFIHSGKKIKESEYAWIITSLLQEGMPETRILKVMKERYSYAISPQSLSAFHKNYFPELSNQLKADTAKFREEQTGRIQTFIDESVRQSNAIQKDVDLLAEHLAYIQNQLAFTKKFDTIFQNAVDSYVEDYNPENHTSLLGAGTTNERAVLTKMVEAMGQQGNTALAMYIQAHPSYGLVKLATYLVQKLKDLRSQIVNIHRDIFKSYKKLSLTQEMTIIFERYNTIIIENFFADKENVDRTKFVKVHQQVSALLEEMKIRFQSDDGDHTQDSFEAQTSEATPQTPDPTPPAVKKFKPRIPKPKEEPQPDINPEVQDEPEVDEAEVEKQLAELEAQSEDPNEVALKEIAARIDTET